MTKARLLGSSIFAALAVSCVSGCHPSATDKPLASPAPSDTATSRTVAYRLISNAVGFDVAVEKGILADGQDLDLDRVYAFDEAVTEDATSRSRRSTIASARRSS